MLDRSWSGGEGGAGRAVLPLCIVFVTIVCLALSSRVAASAEPGFAAVSSAPRGPIPADLGGIGNQAGPPHGRSGRERQGPEGRAARAATRRAFSDLKPGEARNLARRTFPSMIGAADGTPLDMAHGLEVRQLVDHYSARIETATGTPAGVAVSTQPIAAEVNGKLELLDLDLTSQGSSLVTKNAAIDVRYPRIATDTVALAKSGVSFRPVGAEATETLPDANELFFADALPGDTDYALVPKADGVEALWQLRSDSSPETLELLFELPAGALLQPTPGTPGAAQVVASDGSVLASVDAPWATDAEGTPVPAAVSIGGNTLTITVAHHSKDLAYPILVDPVVSEYWIPPEPGVEGGFHNCGARGGNNSGGGAWWFESFTPNGGSTMQSTCDMTWAGWGSGLYSINRSGYWYADQTVGQWVWWAPPDVNIPRVDWIKTRHQAANNIEGNTAAFAGIWDVTAPWWTVVTSWGYSAHWTFTQTSPVMAARAAAVFGMVTNGGGVRGDGSWTGPPAGHAGLEGATVYLNDAYDPTAALGPHSQMTAGASQTNWLDSAATPPWFNLNLADRGLGVWQYSVVRADDTNAHLTGVPRNVCFGTAVWSCPKASHATGNVYYHQASLPEGTTPVRAKVWDINERVGYSPTWSLRIDRSAPTIDLTGKLLTTYPIRDPRASLKVSARDGSASSLATQRSGIKRVEISVDGELAYTTRDLSCASGHSCARTIDWTLRRDDFGSTSGTFEVTVTAVDQLGHASSRTIRPYFEPDERAHDIEPISDAEEDLGDGSTEPCEAPCTEHGSVNPEVRDALNADPLVDAEADASGEPIASTSRINEGNWGISDETPADVLHAYDEGVRRFRKVTPFDIALDAPGSPNHCKRREDRYKPEMDAWYDALKDLPNVKMMVSFGRNFCMTKRENRSVSNADYRTAAEAFMNRYPKVKTFTATNEPNHEEQGFRSKHWSQERNLLGAFIAGARFFELQQLCNSDTYNCKVLAGDFTDSRLSAAFVREYKYGAGLGGKRHVWAIHPYSTVHDRKVGRIKEFVEALKPGSKIWFTEVGAFHHWFERGEDGSVVYRPGFHNDTARQYQNLRWLLKTLVPRKFGLPKSPITHLYYYQWTDEDYDDPSRPEEFGTGLARHRSELSEARGQPFCLWSNRLFNGDTLSELCNP